MACGVCLSLDKYVMEENAAGDVRPIPGVYVEDQDLPALEEVIRLCPVQAMSLIEKETEKNKTTQQQHHKKSRNKNLLFFYGFPRGESGREAVNGGADKKLDLT